MKDQNDKDKNKEKQNLIQQLIDLAKADNQIKEVEFQFILALAGQMGLTRDELKSLFEKHIEFQPPKEEYERVIQFHRLILLMNVDLDIDKKEIDYIKNLGIRMGLHPSATNEILKIMKDYPNNIVPPEKLISVFKTYQN
jgi:hypothetical protein